MANTPAMDELLVVDLGRGRPPAIVARLLAAFGARVVRVAPPGGDPFDDLHPAQRAWREGVAVADAGDIDSLLAEADVCLVGGEDLPGLEWSFDAGALAAGNPNLVVLDICGFVTEANMDCPAVETLVQARSGMTFEHFADRPTLFSFAPASYGAALLGIVGVLAALVARHDRGGGQVVRTSMEQGLVMLWSQLWTDAENRLDFSVVAPPDLRHLIFRCADGEYLQFTYGTPGAVAKVYDLLGIDEEVDPRDPGAPSVTRGPDNYYGRRDLLAPAVAGWPRQKLLDALRARGIAAEPVLAPGDCWDDEQLAAGGLIATTADGTRTPAVPVSVQPAGRPHATSASGSPAARSGPLVGTTVLDFGTLVAGPYASQLLWQLGADVIKIEQVGGQAGAATVRSLLAANRGKRSVCVDAKSPRGQEVIRRLCAAADVVQHNFRVGVAERLGIDPDTLTGRNPGLVTLTTTAFGRTGPKATDAGLDMVVAALTGHSQRSGGADQEPLWYRVPVLDYVCGALGAAGVLAGLYARRAGGRGSDVHVSLLGAALFVLSDLVRQPDGRFTGAPALDAERLGFAPNDRLYRTADGWVAVSARTAEQAAGLARLAGAGEGPATAEAVAAALRGMTSAEALSCLRGHGVWAQECVRDAWARLADGAVRPTYVRDVWAERYGTVTGCFGELLELADLRPAPSVLALATKGEHTRQVLAEVGYGKDEIEALLESGAVGAN